MIDRTIQDLEAQILRSDTLTPDQKREIQALIDTLKAEVRRDRLNPEGLSAALAGVRDSLARFEKSHPGFTLTVNGISTYFANLGI